ncbi:MAG: anhydro-N-acetylmuramic acid kinase, partial [Planctomycetes bacterium]|nr:anhydro-N-acetylmuramic acid kinase [Planctomycetota bacterium]
RFVAGRTVPYPPGLADRVRAAAGIRAAAGASDLDREAGAVFAEAALGVCRDAGVRPADVEAIGSHGQTVTHVPRVLSVQLGDASVIAARTGRPVVSDFRAADIAEGGEGAPLAPVADWWTMRRRGETVLCLNLGGIANLSVVPWEREGVKGFDCGPANALLDALVRIRLGGERAYDRDGALSRAGRVRDDLVALWCDDPFLRRDPPKSTGTDRYGEGWVRAMLRATVGVPDADIAASLCVFTALCVADAIDRWCTVSPAPRRLVVSGGGVHNPALMGALRTALPEMEVVPAGDPDFREAVLFALLAWAHVHGVPGNLPAVTGARRAVVLGRRTP